jgi:hypothetical protein
MPNHPRSAAVRFLAANIGHLFTTEQVDAKTRQVWDPGPRTLTQHGRRFFMGESQVDITPTHQVTGLTPDTLVLDWHDEGGCRIHTTTYRLVRL